MTLGICSSPGRSTSRSRRLQCASPFASQGVTARSSATQSSGMTVTCAKTVGQTSSARVELTRHGAGINPTAIPGNESNRVRRRNHQSSHLPRNLCAVRLISFTMARRAADARRLALHSSRTCETARRLRRLHVHHSASHRPGVSSIATASSGETASCAVPAGSICLC